MSELSEKPPIFVLGCDRSGTSLLRRIFNAHRNLACPTETKFIFQFVKVYETYQSLQGLKNMGYSERDVLDEMRTFICRFLDGYAEKHKKKRWVEKTTHNVNCAEILDKIFDGKVLYVAIVRHGLDVAHSFETLTHDKFTVIDKYRTDGAGDALAGLRHWVVMNRKIIAFKEHVNNRLCLVKYEDLTTRSEEVLREICRFIDEPWDPNMLRYNQQEHDAGWEDPNARSFEEIIPNSGKYKYWPQTVQRRLFEEGREIFAYYGYEL
ncbi:MAG: sulfotransferase [Sedimentisphaerales bacterium]|nr:sulfotransferase [Sedimentisphaerales bacterium]